MKIKYFDKLHKKIKDDPYFSFSDEIAKGVAILLTVSLMTGGIASVLITSHNSHIEDKISNTEYIIENENRYAVQDIFILYKNNEIRLCRREQELKSTESGINVAQSIALGFPISSTKENYIYKFYDIKTNEMIGFTDYEQTSIEQIEEKNKNDAMKNMNGYEFVNLGKKLRKDAFKEHDKVNQEYIDDYIENKRFLRR